MWEFSSCHRREKKQEEGTENITPEHKAVRSLGEQKKNSVPLSHHRTEKYLSKLKYDFLNRNSIRLTFLLYFIFECCQSTALLLKLNNLPFLPRFREIIKSL